MPTKKNQHFVPKFLLKFFSLNMNDKTINIYLLDKDKIIESMPLDSQCQNDYFYNKNLDIENALEKLETKTAILLKNIENTSVLPTLKSIDQIIILIFVIVQAKRTLYSNEQLKEAIYKNWPIHDETFKKNYAKFSSNASAYFLQETLYTLPLVSDLEYKLIVNDTNIPFIISDHPVIFYNQFLEKLRKDGGTIGFATKGLQIFFSFSPKHCIIFYDNLVYKVGTRDKNVIYVSDVNDINAINSLQYINAYKTVYFNNNLDKKQFAIIKGKMKKYRKVEKVFIKEAKLIRNNQINPLILSNTRKIEIKLSLSFLNLNKKAKKISYNGELVIFRNKNFYDKFNLLDKMNLLKKPTWNNFIDDINHNLCLLQGAIKNLEKLNRYMNN